MIYHEPSLFKLLYAEFFPVDVDRPFLNNRRMEERWLINNRPSDTFAPCVL